MPRYDFQESLGYWIVVAHQAYIRAFQERLAPFGITYRQAQVLGWLELEGPMSQTDLATRMLIEPPSLVGVLDRMEQAGLIERRACGQDRRKKLVHARAEANAMWEHIAECGREMRRQAATGLSPKEVATLKRLLGKVRDNVSLSETAATS